MSTASTSTEKTGWLRDNWLVITLGGLVLLVVAGFAYFHSTRVSGLELNVGDFRLRQFSFRRDPFTNTQLSGIKYSDPGWHPTWTSGKQAANPEIVIAKHLDRTIPKRWDLVDFDGTLATADANIFLTLMSASGPEGNYFWLEWTKRHPQHATVFWPAVQQLALDSNYSYLPGLFELVSDQDSDIDSFKKSVQSYLDAITQQDNKDQASNE